MARCVIVFAAVALLSATTATATPGGTTADCDKWKMEWVMLLAHGASYVSMHRAYKRGELTKRGALQKASSLVSKVSKLIAYVESTPACPHRKGKYQKRKKNFLYVAKAFIVAAGALEFYRVSQ